MKAHDMTEWHRAQLDAQQAHARDHLDRRTAAARQFGTTAPAGDPDDPEMKLWNIGGYWAMLFCIWFVFIAPIVLVLTLWD
ncbi:hypothetical protein [uncultured Jannaschia sp.]|uniref:hypothetical protein n=1 Tax=uncultured Jannaschia sp. TaxID=293347 RepID=UPI00261C3FE5|nr:hypothetical protein [uncultured Jannaschia sp.]